MVPEKSVAFVSEPAVFFSFRKELEFIGVGDFVSSVITPVFSPVCLRTLSNNSP